MKRMASVVIGYILVGIVMSAIIGFTLISWIKTPVAYFSYSTGECVRIIIDGIDVPCEQLPKTYEKVWVK